MLLSEAIISWSYVAGMTLLLILVSFQSLINGSLCSLFAIGKMVIFKYHLVSVF